MNALLDAGGAVGTVDKVTPSAVVGYLIEGRDKDDDRDYDSDETLTHELRLDNPAHRRAIWAIKGVIAGRRAGILSPLNGRRAQVVLDAIDGVCGHSAGDCFHILWCDRAEGLHFAVRRDEADGLEFWHE